MRWADRTERIAGFVLGLALLGALGGCQVTRVYRGTALRGEPDQILIGQTDRAGVMRLFGAPSKIQRQRGGDAFFYKYTRQDSRTLTIEEPVLTDIEFFTYTLIREDSELLVVLFDETGIVRSFGYREGARALDR